MTGFWFDGEDAQSSLIDPALRGFLDAGPPPLVLTYSSQPLRDPAAVLGAHVEAARRLGLRLVTQLGWAGFDPAMLAGRWDHRSVHFADHVPHDLLFQRALAVIHHGGTGTTGAGLIAGCPTWIYSLFYDQPFWGTRVRRLGVGGHSRFRRMRADLLAEVVGRLGREEIRRRAVALGDRLRREDGVAAAMSVITRATRG